MNLIAIDFGTERTKLAYMDPTTRHPALLRIGQRDDPYWPSLFHISANGDISVGDDAEEELEKDPKGIIDTLKRQLRNVAIRRNGKSRTPEKLLVALFSKLREEAEQRILDFDPKAETSLVLTHPAACGPEYETILKKAATDSGFKKVILISEPVAAAWYWSSRTGETEDHVVVLDCGGGTVDWAFLTNKNGLLEEDSDFPAGNKQIGGRDIDDELLKQTADILQDREDKEAHKCIKKSPRDYRNRIRRLKERFNRTGHEQELRITKNTHLSLEAQQFSRITKEAFTQQVLSEFQSYLQPIKEKLGKNPSILLVGGSANLKGLKEQVELETKCTVVKLDRRDYAPVIGAICFGFVDNFLKQPTPTSSRSLPIPGHHGSGSNVRYVDAAQSVVNKKTRKQLLHGMTKGQLKGLGDSLNVNLSHVITHGGMVNVLHKQSKVTKEKIISFCVTYTESFFRKRPETRSKDAQHEDIKEKEVKETGNKTYYAELHRLNRLYWAAKNAEDLEEVKKIKALQAEQRRLLDEFTSSTFNTRPPLTDEETKEKKALEKEVKETGNKTYYAYAEELQQGYPAPSKETRDYVEQLRVDSLNRTPTLMTPGTKENIVRGIGIALRLLFMGRP